MSDYQIEKKVPIPSPHVGSRTIYPFSKMAPGDSFVAGIKARGAAYAYGRRHDMEFETRRIANGKKIEYRIWRVK